MRILLLAATLLGCGGATRCPPAAGASGTEPDVERGAPPRASPIASAGPDDSDMWLSLTAPVEEVDDDDVVHYAEDRVAVLAQVPFPLHLFLLKVDPDGVPHMLWPEGESELVSGDVRLPGEGWVELAVPQVNESLVVIAVREGEYMGRRDVVARAIRMAEHHLGGDGATAIAEPPYFVAEGSYAKKLEVDGGDAVRVDVWAEDETGIWIEIEH